MLRKHLLTSVIVSFFAPLLSAQSPGDPVWFFPTGAPVVAAPSINPDGEILFGSEDYFMYSIQPNQTLSWVAKTGDFVTGNVAISPAGHAVYGSWDGIVYASDSAGNTVWSYDTQAFISASPAVAVDGTVYIGARDGILYSLDPGGQLNWFYIANASIEGSPAIGPGGVVYFGDESGTLYALNKDGTVKWRFTPDMVEGRSPRIRSTPAIDRSGNLYFGSGNHFFYALDSSGQLKWKFETQDKNDSSAAIDEEGALVFGSRDGRLYRLDSATGDLIWSRIVGDVFYCSPAVDTNNSIYIAAYIGSGITRLYAVDKSGNDLWSRNYSALNDSSPVLSGDGHLYIGFHDGNLYKIFTGTTPADSVWPMLARNVERTAGLDAVFETAVPFGEWLRSDWFGLFAPVDDKWMFHTEHGWIFPASKDPDSFLFYDLSRQSWIWTARSIYPAVYTYAEGWLLESLL